MTAFNSSCFTVCRIGFIWVLAILDPALQINIHIKARSFYFHIISVLRLHLWSFVLIIPLPMIDPMWLVPILRHLKWEIVLWVVSTNFRFSYPLLRSDVWVVCWRSPRKSPILRQWLCYINVKTSDSFPKWLTQYANSSSSDCRDTHFMCLSFKLFHVSLPTRLHNAPKLINTSPR